MYEKMNRLFCVGIYICIHIHIYIHIYIYTYIYTCICVFVCVRASFKTDLNYSLTTYAFMNIGASVAFVLMATSLAAGPGAAKPNRNRSVKPTEESVFRESVQGLWAVGSGLRTLNPKP